MAGQKKLDESLLEEVIEQLPETFNSLRRADLIAELIEYAEKLPEELAETKGLTEEKIKFEKMGRAEVKVMEMLHYGGEFFEPSVVEKHSNLNEDKITKACELLAEKGLIEGQYPYIFLTEKGEAHRGKIHNERKVYTSIIETLIKSEDNYYLGKFILKLEKENKLGALKKRVIENACLAIMANETDKSTSDDEQVALLTICIKIFESNEKRHEPALCMMIQVLYHKRDFKLIEEYGTKYYEKYYSALDITQVFDEERTEIFIMFIEALEKTRNWDKIIEISDSLNPPTPEISEMFGWVTKYEPREKHEKAYTRLANFKRVMTMQAQIESRAQREKISDQDRYIMYAEQLGNITSEDNRSSITDVGIRVLLNSDQTPAAMRRNIVLLLQRMSLYASFDQHNSLGKSAKELGELAVDFGRRGLKMLDGKLSEFFFLQPILGNTAMGLGKSERYSEAMELYDIAAVDDNGESYKLINFSEIAETLRVELQYYWQNQTHVSAVREILDEITQKSSNNELRNAFSRIKKLMLEITIPESAQKDDPLVRIKKAALSFNENSAHCRDVLVEIEHILMRAQFPPSKSWLPTHVVKYVEDLESHELIAANLSRAEMSDPTGDLMSLADIRTLMQSSRPQDHQKRQINFILLEERYALNAEALKFAEKSKLAERIMGAQGNMIQSRVKQLTWIINTDQSEYASHFLDCLPTEVIPNLIDEILDLYEDSDRFFKTHLTESFHNIHPIPDIVAKTLITEKIDFMRIIENYILPQLEQSNEENAQYASNLRGRIHLLKRNLITIYEEIINNDTFEEKVMRKYAAMPRRDFGRVKESLIRQDQPSHERNQMVDLMAA